VGDAIFNRVIAGAKQRL